MTLFNCWPVLNKNSILAVRWEKAAVILTRHKQSMCGGLHLRRWRSVIIATTVSDGGHIPCLFGSDFSFMTIAYCTGCRISTSALLSVSWNDRLSRSRFLSCLGQVVLQRDPHVRVQLHTPRAQNCHQGNQAGVMINIISQCSEVCGAFGRF